MRFDRKRFFDGMRALEGGLSQQQVNGLESLITSIEKDPYVTEIEWAAYMLATVRHETARTYQPIHEYGGRAYFIRRYGSQTRVGRRLGNDTPEEGAIYAGRGDVQLTGEDNYEKAEAALRQYYPDVVADFEARTGRRFDLTVGDQPGDGRDPDNAQDPAIAYAIMSFGMRTGLFTTKKLSDYTLGNAFDVVQARRIINGLDDAALIAGYYREILAILRRSLVQSVPAVTQAAYVQPAIEPDATIADPLPPAEPERLSEVTVDAPPPTGFMAKLQTQMAALLAFIGGGAGLKEWFGVQLSAETVDLLKVLIPTVLGLGFLGFLVWYIAEKIVGFKTLKLKAEAATDPARHNLVINAK